MKTLAPELIHVEQAKQFMRTYSEKGYGQNVLGVSHEEYIEFIFIGKLCEIVFIMKLRELNVDLMAEDLLIPAAGDHRKGADLILKKSNQSVDIKAGHKEFHTRLLVREDNFSLISTIYTSGQNMSLMKELISMAMPQKRC